MQEAYIVAGLRTAVTKAKRGGFRFTRPDDLAIDLIQQLMAGLPQLDKKLMDDVMVGNAVPEAEQGLQVGRIIAARGLGEHAPGVTVNRYCASGLETIAMATAKIRAGMADCIIAGGVESMSFVPAAGWKTVPSFQIASEAPDYYLPKNTMFPVRHRMPSLYHPIKKPFWPFSKAILKRGLHPYR
jgi:acetyl-CoA acyltransferase